MMRNLSIVTATSFWAEIEKIAAPRALKEIRKLIQAGDTAGAEAMAKRFGEKGALKVSGPGSQLKQLGAGVEGQATLVAGARDAPGQLAVRKAYDPKGTIYSKQVLQDKMDAGRKLNQDPRFAKLYSKRLGRGTSGGRYTMHEYVEGAKPTVPEMRAQTVPFGQMSKSVSGRQLMDFQKNRGNVMMTPGGPKVIDYMPLRNSDIRDVRKLPEPLAAPSPNLEKPLELRSAALESRMLTGSNTSPADYRLHPETKALIGMRPADPTRALRGLGPGSRR